MTYGSIFSGIEGFGLGFEQAGMRCAFQVEIDPDARRVLERHWPDVPRFGDVTTVKAKQLPQVDVVCFGSPCQDLSVAGKRAGLKGERSGLFFEAIRIVRQLRPKFVVFENVPGLLSSNGGNDFACVLDAFNDIGYIVDPAILDAQYFGVAQRRRRVFLLCVELSDLVKKKTPLSRRISADLLAGQLHSIWGVIRPVSSVDPSHSDCEIQTERFVGSAERRMILLQAALGRKASKTSPSFWGALTVRFMDAEPNSASCSTTNTEKLIHTSAAMATSESLLMVMGNGIVGWPSMCGWLNKLSDDALSRAKKSITSTSESKITAQRIFTFALVAMRINALIVRSLVWSPACWNVASSILTVTRENIDFARQSANDLFTEASLRDRWRSYLSAASDFLCEFEQHLRDAGAGPVLFESQGCTGHPAARGAKATDIAGTIGSGSAGRGGNDDLDRAGAFVPETANSCRTQDRRIGQGWNQTMVAHALTAEGHDASEDGTGRGTPLVVAAALRSRQHSPGVNAPGRGGEDDHNLAYQCHGSNVGPMGTIRQGNGNETGSVPFLAFDWQSGGDVRLNVSASHTSALQACQTPAVAFMENQRHELRTSDVADSLKTGGGKPGQGYSATMVGASVRRLTPTECERLQGFPDDWLDIDPPLADSAKYRLLGNAVAVPVAEWIGRRIVECAK